LHCCFSVVRLFSCWFACFLVSLCVCSFVCMVCLIVRL
jgi:hypothetical protein